MVNLDVTKIQEALFQEALQKYRNLERLKVNVWKMICLTNSIQKKTGVAMLILDNRLTKINKMESITT